MVCLQEGGASGGRARGEGARVWVWVFGEAAIYVGHGSKALEKLCKSYYCFPFFGPMPGGQMHPPRRTQPETLTLAAWPVHVFVHTAYACFSAVREQLTGHNRP